MSLLICSQCVSYGKPRHGNCQGCRILHLEARNKELHDRLSETPEPKILIYEPDCKECSAMLERVNQISGLLHESELEKVELMKSYQKEIDKILELNKQLLNLQSSTEAEESLKKNLHEKEEALVKALEEEERSKRLQRLNRLAEPRNPKPKH